MTGSARCWSVAPDLGGGPGGEAFPHAGRSRHGTTRVAAMRGVLIGLVLTAATAPALGDAGRPAFDCGSVREYSTCAVGVGALTGRIVASALACGLPRERWRAVVAMMAGIIEEVAADEADREEGMAMIALAGEAAIRRRQLGTEPEPCDAVARSVDALARDMGVP